MWVVAEIDPLDSIRGFSEELIALERKPAELQERVRQVSFLGVDDQLDLRSQIWRNKLELADERRRQTLSGLIMPNLAEGFRQHF